MLVKLRRLQKEHLFNDAICEKFGKINQINIDKPSLTDAVACKMSENPERSFFHFSNLINRWHVLSEN